MMARKSSLKFELYHLLGHAANSGTSVARHKYILNYSTLFLDRHIKTRPSAHFELIFQPIFQPSPPSAFSNMPTQSRMIAWAPDSDADALSAYTPSNANFHPAVLAQLHNFNPITMPLQPHHIHTMNAEHGIYSLDLGVATSLYNILGQMFRYIHQAGGQLSLTAVNSIDNIYSIPPPLPSSLFNDAGLPEPRILSVYPFYTQNPLICANTLNSIHTLYRVAQELALETAEWIAKARLMCARSDSQYGWRWDDIDREAQLAILGPTAYHALIEAPAAISTDNNSTSDLSCLALNEFISFRLTPRLIN